MWRTPKGSSKHLKLIQKRLCESNMASSLDKSECKFDLEYKVAPCRTELQDITLVIWELQFG